jgi:ABC-type uncharacterized transport system substrate-binding protein
MKRMFVNIAFSVLLFLPASTEAQQPKKLTRIGVLFPGSRETFSQRMDAFLQGMKEYGYTDGKTILIEWRWADRVERMPELASELVKMNPDLIVGNGTGAITALKAATKRIPIVMAVVGDPVGTGLIASLGRPGGNLTGLSIVAPNLGGKRMELLGEITPGVTSVAALVNPKNLVYRNELHETEQAARNSGRQVLALEANDERTLDEAFVTLKRQRFGSLIVLTDPFLFNLRQRILDHAVNLRVPAMYFGSEFPDDGGLMSYGPDMNELFRRAGIYIDKILKGTNPADLPVEQPKKFEFVINLKTAKQIGLRIPPNVLARADRVIR